MHIKTEKNDVCPICRKCIVSPNCWVVYHVSYEKQIVVLSCKYCNYVEFLLRNNIKRNSTAVMCRITSVIAFQKRFNIIL